MSWKSGVRSLRLRSQEIKRSHLSFNSFERSLMYDFHSALGQYVVYRQLIELTQPEYKLYLAIDDITDENFFQRKSIQAVLEANNLLLMVVDIEKEIIVRWTN